MSDEPFRVLITGSRHATDAEHRELISEAIQKAVGHIRACDMDRVILVHGNQRGVDLIAADIVTRWAWPIQVEAHDARDFGSWPAAGPRRNEHMVRLGANVCLAFPAPDSRGTWDCARKAADAGIHTILQTLRIPSSHLVDNRRN